MRCVMDELTDPYLPPPGTHRVLVLPSCKSLSEEDLRMEAGGIEYPFPLAENQRFRTRIADFAKLKRVLNDHS